MPTLHVLEGPNKGRTYRTPHEPTLIGRQTDQVQLSDDSISRRHAEIRPVFDSWILLDLQSSNGTFLNGRRVVSPAPLRHGDQIKVGNSLLVFTGEDDVAGFGSVNDIPNLLEVEENGAAAESAILSAIDCAEQSVVLEAPQTADAVVGWNVICQVAETFSAGESIESSLERVADILFDRLIVDHLVLLTRRTGEEKLRPVVVRYRDKDGQTRPRISASRTIIDHVIKTKQAVLCANAMTDDRFSSENPQDSIHQLALGSVMCVPVVVHRETYGVFHLDCSTSKHNYTPEQLRLVVAIGRLAGMAIENARLQESRMQTARLAATGETVAYLSHHIRNMLQGMQGGAEVVELGLKKRDLRVAGSGWGLVRRNLDRVYHLTLNMLTFSKDRQPRIELCQLNHIVEDALTMA
ncbi:MAG: FHA domain-containing protein, partial [Planctomycetes bacterium]|nr:FHA domain-containing protein [Planctomycetota bacterium]